MARKLRNGEASRYALAMFKRLFGWHARLKLELGRDPNNLVKQGELSFCEQFIADSAQIMREMRISPDDLKLALEQDAE